MFLRGLVCKCVMRLVKQPPCGPLAYKYKYTNANIKMQKNKYNCKYKHTTANTRGANVAWKAAPPCHSLDEEHQLTEDRRQTPEFWSRRCIFANTQIQIRMSRISQIYLYGKVEKLGTSYFCVLKTSKLQIQGVTVSSEPEVESVSKAKQANC